MIHNLLSGGHSLYRFLFLVFDNKKLLKWALFLFLYFLFFSSNGQQIVLSDTNFKLSYKISRNTTENQYLLSYLSQFSEATKIGDPFFYIDLNVLISATSVDSKKALINCTIIKDSIRGNNSLSGFDLSPTLFPNIFKGSLHYLKNGEKSKFDIYSPLHYNQTNVATILLDSVSSISDIHLTDITIHFDSQWNDEIKKQFEGINLYEKSDSLFIRWEKTLQSIDLAKTELIPLLDFDLDDLIQSLKKVENLDLVARLNLVQNDPNNFKLKFSHINILAYQKQIALQECLMNIDQRFVLDARMNKDKGNILQAIYYYNKAIEYHAFNVQALLELSRLYYEIGNLKEASLWIKKVFSTTYPNEYLQKQTIDYGKLLYRKIVNQGNDMYVAQRYSEAHSIFEIANIFCDSNTTEICNNDHTKGIINSKNGIYKSYFSVIHKALQNNYFQIAENYIGEAKKYQLQNIKEIPNDHEIQKYVDILVSKLVETSKGLLTSNQYVKALSKLEKADSVGHMYRSDFRLSNLESYREIAAQGGFNEKLNLSIKYTQLNDLYMAEKCMRDARIFYQQYSKYIRDTSEFRIVDRNIKIVEFNSHVKIGNDLYNNGLYQNALEKYIHAKQISQNYQLSNSSEVDSLILRLSKPLLFDYLSKTRQNIWSNNYNQANIWLARADSIFSSSFLYSDSNCNSELNSTKKLLNDNFCTFQNNKSEIFYNLSLRSKSENDYIKASQYGDSLFSIVNSNRECKFNHQISIEQIEELSKIGNYQKKIKDSRYYVEIGKVDEAMLNFYHADSLYQIFIAKHPVIKKDSIASIFILCNNKVTLSNACMWLIDKQKIKEAFSLLTILKQKGASSKESKNIQKKIAQSLALIDKKENPLKSRKELMLMYSVKGWWFYNFRRYYLGNPLYGIVTN